MDASSSQNYITSPRLLGTAYGLLAVTSIVFVARVAVRIWRSKAVQAEDFILLLAYLLYLCMTTLYVVVTPTMYRVTNAIEGVTPIYPTIVKDSLFMIKIFFANTLLLWFTLWAVKFSFLALYRKLFSGIKVYMHLWWGVVVFALITLIGCVISNFTSCSSMHAWFTPGECLTPRDARAQIISLYYSFAVDVLTDLFIMFLPLRLIWNLQRPLLQKVGIGALFCVGWVCIAAAVIRVVQVGVKSKNSTTPSSSWIAFWSIIEASIAVIVGCCPGLYATAKEVHNTRRTITRTSGYPAQYALRSIGYEKHGSVEDYVAASPNISMSPYRGHSRITSGNEPAIRMKHIPILITGREGYHRSKNPSLSGAFWGHNEDDSQE